MRIVLLDIDGTLVDSNEFDGRLYVESVNDVLGIEIDDDWSTYRNVTDSGVLDEILAEHAPGANRSLIHSEVERAFVEKVRIYLDSHNGRLTEVRGANSFVRKLQAHPGVAVAFATGGWRETAVMKLHAIGLDAESLPIASASEAFSRIDIMKIAEKNVCRGEAATRKTYFGDAPWDKTASSQLGYDFIAIGDGVAHRPRFADFMDSEAIFRELGLPS